jgi:hypothetical protein
LGVTGNITCTVTHTVVAADSEAGVVTGGPVQATLTDANTPPVVTDITGCSLPNVPVYTGSVVQAAGVALAAGETKYLSGETMPQQSSKHCA